jgi:hypothetical protein
MGRPVETSVAAPPGRYRLLPDLYRGAVLGDFAPELGLAGILTQLVLAFVPLIGTVCAVRDFVADRGHGDGLGALLNLLAIIPVLGGFPKTAVVMKDVKVFAKGVRAIHHGAERAHTSDEAGEAGAGRPPANPAAVVSFVIGLFAPFLVPALGLGAAWLAETRLGLGLQSQVVALLGASLLVPLVAVATGHTGLRRGRRAHGYGGGRALAIVGLSLGYIYLVGFLALVAILTLVFHASLLPAPTAH